MSKLQEAQQIQQRIDKQNAHLALIKKSLELHASAGKHPAVIIPTMPGQQSHTVIFDTACLPIRIDKLIDGYVTNVKASITESEKALSELFK